MLPYYFYKVVQTEYLFMEPNCFLRGYTFSYHQGVSSENIPLEKIKEKVQNLPFIKDQLVYAHLFNHEKCVLRDKQFNILGYKDKTFNVTDLIGKVHPEDLNKVYQLTKKAGN